ncbi:MAG: peptidyl-prolyl cis-trans isomerase [Planctomycetes bacterium]|nr:peptidyl-prolyl cis-trans isomerase [Planctomycetota bacterium]
MLIRKGLCLVWLAAVLLCVGCGGKRKYGKYTEEQMQQIGLANKYDLPAPSGNSMVLAVQSETISSDEILTITEQTLKLAAGQMDETAFNAQAQPFVRDIIRGKITDILLYQQARRTAPDTIDDMLEKAVDSEVNRFVTSYGNNYALAESKIKEMGMDWRSFKAYQKRLIMTQSYLSSTLKDEKRFSQQELRNYYDQNKDDVFCKKGEVGFSLIAIWPEEITVEQVAEGETLQAAAKRIAGELVKELENGADFAELAKQYHGDLAAIGGKVLPIEPSTNAMPEPYNSLEATAIGMQPAQIEGPIEIDGHLFILKLDTLVVADCKSFEEVQQLIEQQLLFQHNQQQYKELVNKLVMNSDLAQMDRFTEFCVNLAYRRWSQS